MSPGNNPLTRSTCASSNTHYYHRISDTALNLFLQTRLPNQGVDSWWSRVPAPRVVRPILGDSLNLTPLCGARQPAETIIRKFHDRGKIKHIILPTRSYFTSSGSFIPIAGLSPLNNSPIHNPDSGKISIYGSISEGVVLDTSKESRWVQPATVFELSECMLNSLALSFAIR